MEETTKMIKFYNKYVITRQVEIDEFKREYNSKQSINSNRFIILDNKNLINNFEQTFEKYRNNQNTLLEMTNNIIHNHEGEICLSNIHLIRSS